MPSSLHIKDVTVSGCRIMASVDITFQRVERCNVGVALLGSLLSDLGIDQNASIGCSFALDTSKRGKHRTIVIKRVAKRRVG